MKAKTVLLFAIIGGLTVTAGMFLSISIFQNPAAGSIVSIICVMVLVIGILLFKLTRTGGYGVSEDDRSKSAIKAMIPDRTEQITRIIRQRDVEFSEVKFKAFAEYVYVTLWEEVYHQNIDHIRMFLHDNFYEFIKKDMDERANAHLVRVLEDNNVSDVYLTAYGRDDRFERVSVCLYAICVFYEKDERTGEMVKGNPKIKGGAGYILDFVRNKDVRTRQENGELKSRNCPNCGAPVENTGKCGYCGSVLTTGAYSWVLTSIRPVIGEVTDFGINIQEEGR